MAVLKFEGFLGDIPYLDSTGLPEQNSRHNKDCWFIDGKLRPIKEALSDGTVPSGTKTLYRYRPCPKDASQAYWITRTESYNVAPSPIPNDKYGRLYFTRKKYAMGDAIELPHFYDVKGLLGRTNNTDLCTNTGTEPFPVSGATKYTLGVPAPATAKADLTSGYTALGFSTDGRSWDSVSTFVGTEFAFTKVGLYGSTWLAGGYNGVIATSTDGENWSAATTPLEAVDYTVRCFSSGTIGATTYYIAGCNNGKILVSTDPDSWQESPALGVTISGNITAAIFWDGCFWIGTSTGKTYRTLSGDTVGNNNNVTRDPTQENAWKEATGPSGIFAGQAITDAALWRSRPYFVGGGGLMVCPNATTRSATTAWSNQSDDGVTGTYRSIKTSSDETKIIAVTDSAFVTAANSTPTVFARTALESNNTLNTIFKGAKLKAGVHGTNGEILLVGTNGAVALYQQNEIIPSLYIWIGVVDGEGLGATPLYSVEYAAGTFVAAGGVKTSSEVAVAPRYYAITFMDGFGAESAPALASKVTASPGDGFEITWGVNLDMVGDNPKYTVNKDPSKAKFYIYRTASSGTSTDFLRVAEVPYVANQTNYSYKDTKTDDVLGEVMLSTDWIMPPEGLRGLVTLPGGVLAGFVDNTLWFSEPGQPHAWPVKYQRTVSAPIVGLSTFANSVLVTTIDRSFIASGMDPFNMALTELETDQSCVSADSVVDMGGYAIYASPRGLVKVSNMNPEWITKQLFTPVQWAQLEPATLRAALWEGRYLAFFSGTPTYAAGEVKSFSIVPGADVDGVSWYTQAADLAFTDSYDDKVYFVTGETTNGVTTLARKIWNAGENNKTCLWRSKMLQSPESLNFGWLQAQMANEGDDVLTGVGLSPLGMGETGNYVKVRLYSEEGYTPLLEATIQATDHDSRQTAFTLTEFEVDGTEKATYSGIAYDATIRLPAGRRTRFHLVDVETNAKVLQVLLTQSALELRSQ